MRWSRAKLRMAGKLQAIERAHKTAAEARLGDARHESDEAATKTRDARDELDSAERSWSAQLSARRIDIEIQLAFTDELLRRECNFEATKENQRDADARLDRARLGWQQLEAGVRAGDRMLRNGRRILTRQGEEARDRTLSDLTTWEWFKR